MKLETEKEKLTAGKRVSSFFLMILDRRNRSKEDELVLHEKTKFFWGNSRENEKLVLQIRNSRQIMKEHDIFI